MIDLDVIESILCAHAPVNNNPREGEWKASVHDDGDDELLLEFISVSSVKTYSNQCNTVLCIDLYVYMPLNKGGNRFLYRTSFHEEEEEEEEEESLCTVGEERCESELTR